MKYVYYIGITNGLLAQLVEQRTLNSPRLGSSPRQSTKILLVRPQHIPLKLLSSIG